MSSPYSLLSHRLSDFSSTISSSTTSAAMAVQAQSDASLFGGALVDAFKKHTSDPHSSHPDFAHLVLLVFEAVLEVVFISLPGYILARTGNFDAKQQKFIAEMNTSLFTPALIFTKLASQLTAETLIDLAIIPVIFVIQTAICYGSAEIVARLFRFRKRARYFVIAMAVFGNSNSLPISLVVSLSMTLKGLHWDKIPGDNDNEVAARGILYLLIFQQLGQVVRWSWGYNVLLAPADQFPDEPEGRNSRLERGDYLDSDPALTSPLLHDDSYLDDDECLSPDGYRTAVSHSDYESGAATPAKHGSYGSDIGSSSNSSLPSLNKAYHRSSSRGSSAGRRKPSFGNGHITSFPRPDTSESGPDDEDMAGKGWCARLGARCRNAIKGAFVRTGHAISRASWNLYQSLPSPLQLCLRTVWTVLVKFWNGLNPPLWAMIAAIVVASFPRLQHLFYDKGTLISNSFSRAVSQSGGVAVPLILVVLGGNLARNTLPEKDVHSSQHDPKLERNLLIASLISRMVVPFIVMAPILALFAKYVPVSILDDPIFIIVCFLLTGAPTALQLAQICQMNDVYMGVMSKILFQSYVVWILPSTLILVMAALEVVEWAT